MSTEREVIIITGIDTPHICMHLPSSPTRHSFLHTYVRITQAKATQHAGSNRGLGYLTAGLLGASNSPERTIILTSRTLQRARDAAAALQKASAGATFAGYELDVADPESVFNFGEQIGRDFGRVDCLVNNSGINSDPFGSVPSEDTSLSAVRERFKLGHEVFGTNVIGADALTYQLLPLLRKSRSPRLIFTTSGVGSIALNVQPDHAWYGVMSYMYRASKSALNMTMTNWYKRLSGEGIAVYAVCPGFNATEFAGIDPADARKAGAQEPEIGARVIADVVEGKMKGDEGKVVAGDGVIRPW